MHPVQGEIWCLHRVVEKRSEYLSNRELEITPQYLETIIQQHESRGYKFVTLEDLLKSKPVVFPEKQINISFDDGFRDVYTNAFPILKKHNIPFTIYLTTDFPDGKADLWWIQLEEKHSLDEFERLTKQIYDSYMPMAGFMHELTETEPDYGLARSLSLSWNELKEMEGTGLCTIGSHSVSHPGLVRISEDSCVYELCESKRIIEAKLGAEVAHFSYPHSMQNASVQRMVAEAGYRSATLGYGGKVRKGDNMYCLNRKHIIQD